MVNSTESTAPAVVVDDLRVVRGGREVLPGLSLAVPPGQVVGLLGPSGGGKTTLMRSIVGVQQVASGTVTVLGRPAGDPWLRSRVAYVTQSPSVYGDLTVAANLRYFGRLLGLRGPALDAAVERVVRSVDLADHAGSAVGRLSGGQRSRVSLAAALLGTPRLLVLDEPTVGLDPVLRRDLWNLFGRLAADGVTLFVSSHVMDEATRCDRLMLLREGRLLADETPHSLLERTSAHDAEEAFLRLIEAEGQAEDKKGVVT
ncbi:MAG: ABC transporter ATP-binding protein [Actinomycetota bacterium]|nr:ABC transporter ATP-binding protein [Actinomycetota bacterium]